MGVRRGEASGAHVLPWKVKKIHDHNSFHIFNIYISHLTKKKETKYLSIYIYLVVMRKL